MFVVKLSVAVHHRTTYWTAVDFHLIFPPVNPPSSTVNGAWFEACVTKQSTSSESELESLTKKQHTTQGLKHCKKVNLY